jgi:hypothetical protein
MVLGFRVPGLKLARQEFKFFGAMRSRNVVKRDGAGSWGILGGVQVGQVEWNLNGGGSRLGAGGAKVRNFFVQGTLARGGSCCGF